MYRATLEFVEERAAPRCGRARSRARGVDDDVLGLRGVPGAVEREARKHKKPPPPGSLLGVDLLCEGVWRRVCAALLETPELSGLFDLGDADAAHRAVAATDSFREGLAAIAGKGDRDAERHARRRLRGPRDDGRVRTKVEPAGVCRARPGRLNSGRRRRVG